LFPTVSSLFVIDLMNAGLSKDQIMTVRREVTGKHCGLSCQLTRGWLRRFRQDPKDIGVKAKPRRLNIAMWKAGRRADSA
jgi:hypothetical protein